MLVLADFAIVYTMEENELQKLADLARIAIPKDELNALKGDLEAILNYVSQIQKVSADSAEMKPSVHAEAFLREDVSPHESGAHTKEILSGAPKTKNGYIEVKKILA